ncbi:MAG: perosamine synthetase domain protein [Paenibacillus sp.]|uniref:GNAT family N-acetyltransferase n=1 Tax=Paenibacillus sp. GCM10012303 TaxID=3317340 RepID=UPI0029EBD279|nr:perosamine synthetase domain protein [Paenibacillus sp.]
MKELLQRYKYASADQLPSYCIPITVNGKTCGRLRPITPDTLHSEEEIRLLTEWRSASGEWFTTQFPVTEHGTRQWLEQQVLQADDRILFFVDDEDWNPIAQVGFLHYDEVKKQCEFDNLLRGRKGRFGNIMIYALLALGEWSIRVLDLQTGYLNVLADNARAIAIYKKLGFQEEKRTPLVKQVEGDVTRWVAAEDDDAGGEAQRYLVTMKVRTEGFYDTLKHIL